MNYESALEYIHAVQWAGHKPGLSRTRTLLAALGDPHKKLRFVHVAGTNGKGSTAAMLASCLQAAVLIKHGDPRVADAFCASRLAGDWGGTFGTLPRGLDLAGIVARTTPHLES